MAIHTSNIYDDYIWIEKEEQRDYIISIDKKTQKVKCTYNGTKVGKAKTSASFRKVDLTSEAKQIIEMVRKTFASILVNDGIMDISEVAQLLGHVSEQTLINHYLYPTKSSETRRERLEKALAM